MDMPRKRKAAGDKGLLSSYKHDQAWPAKTEASKEDTDLQRHRRELVSVCRVRNTVSAELDRPASDRAGETLNCAVGEPAV